MRCALRGRRPRFLFTLLAALVSLAFATAAFAAVSPTPNANDIGAGGYDAASTNPAGFTDNQAVIQADQYGLQISGGRVGVKMCNASSGESAVIGEHSSNTNTDYAVQYGAGVGSPGCPAGEVPAASLVTFPNLAAVPFGHHVWVDERVVTRTFEVKFLICILFDRHHHPVPTPTGTGEPSVTNPTSPPTTEQPTSPATTAAALAAKFTQTGGPVPEPQVTEPGGPINPEPHGFHLLCRIVIRTFTKHAVVFTAQDLDAPVATPLAGDLAGVQTAVIRFGSGPGEIPVGTVFDHGSNGISENTSLLTGCSGAGFPTLLAGPAAYDSAACQPVAVFEYAAATEGAGSPADFQALTSTEVISRTPPSSANADALVAPDNSITPTNLGPHGPTAAGAVTAGSHYVDFTGNVSLTPAPVPSS
jgi:hypothetical protein